MKAIQLLAGAGFAALIACTPALAQDGPPPPPPGAGGHHMGMPERRAPMTRAEVEKTVAERFAALDANHDGVVTRAEIDAARDARHAKMETARETAMKEHRMKMFDRLDTNHDGTISREEFAAAAPPPPPGGRDRMAGPGPMGHGPMEHGPMGRQAMRGPMHGPAGGPDAMMGSRWLELVLDAHDGKATLAQVKTSALAMFDRLDLNHDGTITRDERRMAFRGMRWRGHGPDRGAPLQPPAKG
jgi:Ca2+-binding EF-hand superfamily protein